MNINPKQDNLRAVLAVIKHELRQMDPSDDDEGMMQVHRGHMAEHTDRTCECMPLILTFEAVRCMTLDEFEEIVRNHQRVH